ncbi:MAG: ABC transporter ATP-binding protein [Eubacteriales bacterium]|nr:ABC transporter ATP-binding protein [Eubacteriales bacterium]MDD4327910.1 ABC transporter ATP-binding protein [Eubacteriales bacterium]MDD4717785.1 ABC transporter ATP-binding protein [Eubacteriales bacterium]
MEHRERSKKSITLKRLWVYISEYRLTLLIIMTLNIAANMLMLTGPYLAGKAMGTLGSGPGQVDFDKLIYYCVLMVIMYLSSSILSYFIARMMIRYSQKIIVNMRRDVFNKFLSLPVDYFDKNQTGELLSRITYDVDTINTSLSNDVIAVSTSVVTVIGSLIMMLAISPVLILVFAVTVPMSFLFTKFITGRTRPLFRKRSVKLGKMNAYMEEMISGHMTIKSYNRENNVVSKFDEKNDEAVKAYYKSEFMSGVVGPSINFINNISLTLIGLFGTIMFMNGRINIDAISSFVLYSRKFAGPINAVANVIGELQSALAAADRVFSLLDEDNEPADPSDAVELAEVKGEIEFRNIYFEYEKDNPIITNFSFTAKPGSVTAIVGPTGAGKTTIVNLLMRYYDPQKGRIFIDGKDVTKIRRNSLRKAFTMVLQETWLFNGTISENIGYAKKDPSDEEIREAAKSAKIDKFISKLPDGYNTLITDDGLNISSGQKQLITIARALLAEAKLLILDEATSNVDTRTEVQIRKAMLELMSGKTCFVIAHRLSTIKNADNILVVKGGNIVEQGTHDELIAGNGFYKEMFEAQFMEI